MDHVGGTARARVKKRCGDIENSHTEEVELDVHRCGDCYNIPFLYIPFL